MDVTFPSAEQALDLWQSHAWTPQRLYNMMLGKLRASGMVANEFHNEPGLQMIWERAQGQDFASITFTFVPEGNITEITYAERSGLDYDGDFATMEKLDTNTAIERIFGGNWSGRPGYEQQVK